MMIHYPTLKKEVLVAIRGKFSRNQCSEKLGFTFNKVQRWESGKAEIDWLEFVELSRVCRKDFASSFKKNLGFNHDLQNYSALLQNLIPENEMNQIAKQLSIPKASLQAWMKGKRVPKLIHMLKILHEYQRLLVDIIAPVIDLEKLPSLKNEVQHQKKLREFHYQFPFSAGVVALLDSDPYKNGCIFKEGLFVQYFGINRQQERDWIFKAKELGIIEVSGNKIRIASPLHVDTQGDFEAHKKIKEFWIQKTLARMKELKEPDPLDRFGYLVFNGSEELMKEIQKEYYEFFQKMKTLILSDEGCRPSNAICILNAQIQVQIVNKKC